MSETPDVWLTLSVDDPQLDAEELENLTQNFQNQLREIAEQVNRVPSTEEPTRSFTQKGDKPEPGSLNLQINLDSIKTLATWLYERLMGKTTKAKVKFGEGSQAIEFEFEGNNQKDLATTMKQVEVFVQNISQIQRG
jgi:hypothetical protein